MTSKQRPMDSQDKVNFTSSSCRVADECISDSESTNDIEDLYRMYINDPGDDDILDEEENTIGLRAMADFLHGVVD